MEKASIVKPGGDGGQSGAELWQEQTSPGLLPQPRKNVGFPGLTPGPILSPTLLPGYLFNLSPSCLHAPATALRTHHHGSLRLLGASLPPPAPCLLFTLHPAASMLFLSGESDCALRITCHLLNMAS